jgi:hypothetical protein
MHRASPHTRRRFFGACRVASNARVVGGASMLEERPQVMGHQNGAHAFEDYPAYRHVTMKLSRRGRTPPSDVAMRTVYGRRRLDPTPTKISRFHSERYYRNGSTPSHFQCRDSDANSQFVAQSGAHLNINVGQSAGTSSLVACRPIGIPSHIYGFPNSPYLQAIYPCKGL